MYSPTPLRPEESLNSGVFFSSNESANYIKIPKSSLGYQTNNVYPNYPPIMSDGRTIVATDQSETIINNSLLKESGVKTNWDYRKYLTDNSEKIREINTLEAFNDVGYYKRSVTSVKENPSSTTKEPFTEMMSSSVQSVNGEQDKIGTYNNNSTSFSPSLFSSAIRSDNSLNNHKTNQGELNQLYKTREELSSRIYAPSIYL